VTSVIGKASRAGEGWMYLDAGVFNGLLETIGGFRYEFVPERPGQLSTWTLAGPSCDSVDTLQSSVDLPDLETGERVYVMNAGAYTASYASSFNGFGPPETVIL
jgi:ornithine decarboxylase